jgi:hypothetical protein
VETYDENLQRIANPSGFWELAFKTLSVITLPVFSFTLVGGELKKTVSPL